MTAPSELPVVCHLRQRRNDAGLSQGELAERVGISRQAVIAIEAGRQIPSTTISLALARSLRCSVEDLFLVQGGPRLEAALAQGPDAPKSKRLALGLVDGRWAAHPVLAGDRPVDALLVDELPDAARVGVQPLANLGDLENNVLVAGCAPLLGVLAGCLERRFEDARATWIGTNSTRSLELLGDGLVHVAGLHLVDADSPDGHAPLVRNRFSKQAMTLVNLARWRQGLVVACGNPRNIRGVEDLLRPDLRVVRRDAGSGAHELVKRLLAARGIADAALPEGPLASGHTEVARLIRLGLADVGVAAEAAALSQGLGFVELALERFDLVVPEARLRARPVARLLELIESAGFRADASRIAGYDLSSAGHASTVNPG